MSETKRVRLELDWRTYSALKYLGLLRGQPIGHVLRHALARYGETVEAEFPAVLAHCNAEAEARRSESVAAAIPGELPY